MQAFSFFFFLGYSLCVGGGGISGRVRALNLTVPLGSGRVGSDNLGYGPGSGFSFEPVQTSMQNIEFGSVSSELIPDSAENASIEAIPILNIGSAHPYFLCRFSTAWYRTVQYGSARLGTAQFGSVCVSTAV